MVDGDEQEVRFIIESVDTAQISRVMAHKYILANIRDQLCAHEVHAIDTDTAFGYTAQTTACGNEGQPKSSSARSLDGLRMVPSHEPAMSAGDLLVPP